MRLARAAALASLCLAVAAIPAARAAESGQERAQEAGRALLRKPAPALVGKTVDGESVDLGALYGKRAVYLKFWATWCVPCRQQMPHFQHAFETAGPDLAVIAVDVGFNDSVEAVKSYRKKLGITMPIIFDDGSLGSAFKVRVTPTHVVIGRDGKVLYVGHLADAQLDAALAAARSSPGAEHVSVERHGSGVETPAVGDRLPALELRTLEGGRFELRPAGSPAAATALVFISPWCESYLEQSQPGSSASCKRARTAVESLSKSAGIRWLGIASGLWADEDDLRQYRSKYGVTIPLSLDASGTAFRRFRVNDVPTLVVAGPDGRIIRRIDPAQFQDPAALRQAIEAAAAGAAT